ncbi:hypothetical protein B0J12DRAFT_705672 [Macrophomina phaseolina]|uniref:Uncharacterized protein n=1 Tax=Macrophomina phaseolina TaxID=35725 RepID=A0ABQ8FRI8_9PEZI|nr:hypothetical protein B0J12DRAFT_705672 [Macrophomina phaseolina]
MTFYHIGRRGRILQPRATVPHTEAALWTSIISQAHADFPQGSVYFMLLTRSLKGSSWLLYSTPTSWPYPADPQAEPVVPSNRLLCIVPSIPWKARYRNLYLSNQGYLRDDSQVLCDLYCSWCMEGIIYAKGEKGETQASLHTERNLSLEFYFYGAKTRDAGFQDAVTDAMTDQFTRHPQLLLDQNHADKVYKRTREKRQVTASSPHGRDFPPGLEFSKGPVRPY